MEVFHSPEQSTEKKLIEPLSQYGKGVVKALDKFNVERGVTWDIWHDAVFENDGDDELQHPPQKYIGQPSANLNVTKCCSCWKMKS